MKTLRKLQTDFQRFVLSGREEVILSDLCGDAGTSVAVRLGVYFDAYRLRLIDALRGQFTVLEALLGKEEFTALAHAYIDSHRSPYYNIRYYGDELAKYLSSSQPWRERPWLGEMAEFEWSMLAAFDGTDATPLTIEDMAAVAVDRWPALRFRAHPSVRRLRFSYETPALWKRFKNGEAIQGLPAAEDSHTWLIWRRELETYFRSLGIEEGRMLEALLEGKRFAEVCESLDPGSGDAALRAATLLKTWLSEGVIGAIEE